MSSVARDNAMHSSNELRPKVDDLLDRLPQPQLWGVEEGSIAMEGRGQGPNIYIGIAEAAHEHTWRRRAINREPPCTSPNL